MKDLGHANSFKDLVVYQKARSVAKTIFEITKALPREEMYSLTTQVRRSSRAIGAQIAEAWAKRRYEKHFVSKLTDADAEQQETQHWLETAKDCGYVNSRETRKLSSDLSEIGRMLGAMARKAHLFCTADPSVTRESASEYFVPDR